MVDKFIPFIKM